MYVESGEIISTFPHSGTQANSISVLQFTKAGKKEGNVGSLLLTLETCLKVTYVTSTHTASAKSGVATSKSKETETHNPPMCVEGET